MADNVGRGSQEGWIPETGATYDGKSEEGDEELPGDLQYTDGIIEAALIAHIAEDLCGNSW
jgi:hypothetical protein